MAPNSSANRIGRRGSRSDDDSFLTKFFTIALKIYGVAPNWRGYEMELCNRYGSDVASRRMGLGGWVWCQIGQPHSSGRAL
jgi:hypothetical protein